VTTILLARHGETDWNAERRFAHGREQARALGRELAEGPLDAIYTSDLARAREIAEIAGRRTAARVEARHRGGRILVVAHGGTIRTVRAHALAVDPAAHRRLAGPVRNCEVVEIRAENGTSRSLH
jgi:probable phosphoglycerate mutase